MQIFIGLGMLIGGSSGTSGIEPGESFNLLTEEGDTLTTEAGEKIMTEEGE